MCKYSHTKHIYNLNSYISTVVPLPPHSVLKNFVQLVYLFMSYNFIYSNFFCFERERHRFQLGTPPVETYAIPDTGSSLTWLQCHKFINGYNQSVPIFELYPTESSSYKPILHGAKGCITIGYPETTP